MNRQRRAASTSKTLSVHRLLTIAAAVLLALGASVPMLSQAMPSQAQADPASVEAPTVYFVDWEATGANSGATWHDAFRSLQDALAEVSGGGGVDIWVAEGVYYPDEGEAQTNGDRTATFQLKPGVAIYGGFDGTENLPSERDWVNNVTVLSGDLDKNDDTDPNGVVLDPADIQGEDNAYHVVTAEDVMSAAVLDGFVVTAGLADSDLEATDHEGAGIFVDSAEPTLANLIIQGNKADGELLSTPTGYGGGIYVHSGTPQYSNVTIRNNYARTSGGGLYVTDSDRGIANITFEGNVAEVNGGGMYVVTTAGHSMTNLTFESNAAGDFGGGLYIESGVALSSLGSASEFTENTATRGGGLYVASSGLSLNSVLFQRNEASDQGGGIYSRLSSYYLTGVTFNDNHAGSAGGGLYADRNAGTVTASMFNHNTSALGAGMYVDDQAHEDATLTISDPVFVNNIASQNGGGLYVEESKGTLDGGSFLYNQATAGIGGGMVLSSTVDFELSDTEFAGNTAVSGGGMFVEESEPDLADVRFEDNQAQLTWVDDSHGGGGIYLTDSSNATISDCTFSGNSAATGGGMFIDDSNPTLTNVAFTGNAAGDGLSGSGGGLWNNEGSPILSNVLFGGNAATLDGGGMWNGGAGGNPVLINTTFSGNLAGGYGGGLNTTRPNTIIRNSVIWNNKDVTGTGTSGASLTGADYIIEYSLIQGLALASPNLDGTLAGNDPQFVVAVDPNSAPTLSGDLTVKFGSPIVDVGDNLAVLPGVTTDLAGNMRIYNGAVDLGAYELPLACPPAETDILYVDRAKSVGKSGTSWADALKNLRDALTLVGNCEGNVIGEVWVAQGIYRPDEGVGVVPNSRDETYQMFNGVAVYGGFANGDAFIERDWVANLTVLSGDVDSNDTASGGVVNVPGNIVGANSYHVVVASGVGDTAILDGFTITAGQANGSATDPEGRGGGIYNDGGNPTLGNLTFIGNFSQNGGGLANLNGGDSTLTAARFENNMAVSAGGGIYNETSSPTLSGLLFTGNFAARGSGMANLNSSNPSLTGIQFRSNTAGTSGGGIYNQLSSPTLTDVTLSGNSAPTGGAIYNDASTPTLINALLSGNYSALNGAAVYNTGSGPVLVNVTVAGNRAGTTAGGMFNTNTSLPALHNSIFWNNQDGTGAGTASATIHNDDLGSIPEINYSLVQELSGIDHTGDHNLDLNPRFTAPVAPSTAPSTAGDYTLSVFSPAIDVGDNAANSTLADLAGDPRVINLIIDMGAYEAPYRPVYRVYLPVVLRNYP